MNSNIPYISIHTHSELHPGEIGIVNVFLQNYFKSLEPIGGYLSVGVHPWHLDENSDLSEIKSGLEIAAGSENVLAIGETGIDKSKGPSLELQEKVFEAHIEISEKLNKPVIIHCVRAFQELLSIRKRFHPKQPWIFHGFNGSPQLSQQIIDSGCFVSFGKDIMKESTRATHSLLHLGLDKFFLETDDSSHSIASIYEMAAFIKQIPVEELKIKLQENFFKVFAIEF